MLLFPCHVERSETSTFANKKDVSALPQHDKEQQNDIKNCFNCSFVV